MDATTILRENLRILMDAEGWSNRRLSQESGVSDRFIGMILGKDAAPTLKVVEQLAAAFHMEAWELINPNLRTDLMRSALSSLMANYAKAGPAGREFIDRVAAREAAFGEQESTK